MTTDGRRHIRALTAAFAGLVLITVATACGGSSGSSPRSSSDPRSTPASGVGSRSGTTATAPTGSSTTSVSAKLAHHEFTFGFAGDVHFTGRTATLLARDPATVFGPARAVLAKPDLTMVNLETAITTGGDQQDKEFTFRAPPSALTALRDGGVDVATMANNHGADYGASGLQDTLTAIRTSHFPVVGIGSDAAHAYRPWTTTVRGTRIAVLAASQVQDQTLANFTAGPSSPGIASAYAPQFLDAVRAAHAAGYVTIVYVHWGTEYTNCPNSAQEQLAAQLSAAGAAAVIGTHVHELQGAGWRPDGTFVAYSLGNYLWWRSFGNAQDDNGVLTLTFRDGAVVRDTFHPAHLDDSGVPVPATGAQKQRIDAEWDGDRACTDLSAVPPSH